MPPRNPADRPATEPRTENRDRLDWIKWALHHDGDPVLIEQELDLLLAIEAEAAQGAAPLDEPTASDGTPAYVPERHDLRADVFVTEEEAEAWVDANFTRHPDGSISAPKEGAAPRAEGLPEHLRGDGPCDDCGTLDNIGWFTDNVVWNRVTGEQVFHEEPRSGIVCIPCFVKRADAVGLHPTGWRLLPEWPWRERQSAASRPSGERVPEEER